MAICSMRSAAPSDCGSLGNAAATLAPPSAPSSLEPRSSACRLQLCTCSGLRYYKSTAVQYSCARAAAAHMLLAEEPRAGTKMGRYQEGPPRQHVYMTEEEEHANDSCARVLTFGCAALAVVLIGFGVSWIIEGGDQDWVGLSERVSLISAYHERGRSTRNYVLHFVIEV